MQPRDYLTCPEVTNSNRIQLHAQTKRLAAARDAAMFYLLLLSERGIDLDVAVLYVAKMHWNDESNLTFGWLGFLARLASGGRR